MKVSFVLFTLLLASCLAEQPRLGFNMGPFFPGNKVVGRITNGENAVAGDHPYQISYQRGTAGPSGAFSHICGGVIVSQNYVLTAAHCITQVSASGYFRIVAGILTLNSNQSERQNVEVVEKIVHPLYGGGVGPNDLGILKLANPLVLSPVVQTIGLPQPGEVAGGEGILSGWGSTASVGTPNDLQKLNVPILPNQQCNDAINSVLPSSQNLFNFESNICSGPLSGGYSACSGDSGGPLAQNGTLYGLVSWGIIPCGTVGAPTVYTKVENFLLYIQTNVPDLPK